MASEKPTNKLPNRQKTLAFLRRGRRPSLPPGSESELAWKGLEKLYREGHLQDLMMQIEQEITPSSPSSLPATRYFIGIAASLILALATWWLWPAPPIESESWVLNLPAAVPLAGADRGQSIRTVKQQAVEAYQQQKYKEAIWLFDTYLQKVPTDQLVRLYYGISLLKSSDYVQGLEALQDVHQFMIAPELRPASDWYLSLAYYYNDQASRAVELLKGILDQPGHPYRSDALAMLAWM